MNDTALWQEIQSAIDYGYGVAAEVLAPPYAHYRPVGTGTPIAPENQIGALPASFSTDDYRYKRAPAHGKPIFSTLIDRSQIALGDYLVGPEGTFFIAGMRALLPVISIECNALVSFSRPGRQDVGVGSVDNGSADPGPGRPLFEGWPASMLQGTKGEKSSSGLVRDSRNPWFVVLLPFVDGVDIRTDDEMTDDRGQRFIVSSTELGPMGWRLSIEYAGA